MATARPVKISGVEATSVSVRGRMADARSFGSFRTDSEDDPGRIAEGPDEHRVVGVPDVADARDDAADRIRGERLEVLDVRDEHEHRPTRKAEKTARIGTTAGPMS